MEPVEIIVRWEENRTTSDQQPLPSIAWTVARPVHVGKKMGDSRDPNKTENIDNFFILISNPHNNL